MASKSVSGNVVNGNKFGFKRFMNGYGYVTITIRAIGSEILKFGIYKKYKESS